MMVSFDVVSLFTRIPVGEALRVIEDLLANDDTLGTGQPYSQLTLCLLPDCVLPPPTSSLEVTFMSKLKVRASKWSVCRNPIHDRGDRRINSLPWRPCEKGWKQTGHQCVQENHPHGPLPPLQLTLPSKGEIWHSRLPPSQSRREDSLGRRVLDALVIQQWWTWMLVWLWIHHGPTLFAQELTVTWLEVLC